MLVQPRPRLGPNATPAQARDATTKIMAAFAIPANLQQLGLTKVFLRSVGAAPGRTRRPRPLKFPLSTVWR